MADKKTELSNKEAAAVTGGLLYYDSGYGTLVSTPTPTDPGGVAVRESTTPKCCVEWCDKPGEHLHDGKYYCTGHYAPHANPI